MVALPVSSISPTQGVHAALDELAALDPGGLSAAGQAQLLVDLRGIESRICAYKLVVLTAAEKARTAQRCGDADTAAWAAKHTREDSSDTSRQTKLATGLAAQGPTRQALGAGVISPGHAEVIVNAGRKLPEDLTSAERTRVEQDLVAQAKELAPSVLRQRARRALAAIERERDEVDAHEQIQVADEEERARARARLTLRDNQDGTVTGHFTVPVFHGHLLRKLIQTMTAPRRTHTNSEQGATGSARQTGASGDAFGAQSCPGEANAPGGGAFGVGATSAKTSPTDASDPSGAGGPDGLFDLPEPSTEQGTDPAATDRADQAARDGADQAAADRADQAARDGAGGLGAGDLAGLPDAGRVAQARRSDWANAHGLALCELIEHLPTDHLNPKSAATIVVTVEEAVLRGHLAAAGLDTGEKISAAQVRQLACNSGLIPAVLGGKSLPLDLGRSSRLFSEAQRTALATQHTTCAATGCQRPYAWCELHHQVPWSQGGRTDLDQAIPLCHRHHRLIHDHRYQHTKEPNGTITITMRQ